MAHANDCELLRAYVRPAGQTIAHNAIPNGAAFDLVVDVEAGGAVWTLGPPYFILAVVKDLTTGAVIPPGGVQHNGNLAEAAGWNTQATVGLVVHAFPAQGAAAIDHLYEANVVLRVGPGADPIVAFAEDVLFIIT